MSQISSWSTENVEITLEEINKAVSVISHGSCSPVKFQIHSDVDMLKPSTKRYIKRKATGLIEGALDTLAPGQSEKLLKLCFEVSALIKYYKFHTFDLI